MSAQRTSSRAATPEDLDLSDSSLERELIARADSLVSGPRGGVQPVDRESREGEPPAREPQRGESSRQPRESAQTGGAGGSGRVLRDRSALRAPDYWGFETGNQPPGPHRFLVNTASFRSEDSGSDYVPAPSTTTAAAQHNPPNAASGRSSVGDPLLPGPGSTQRSKDESQGGPGLFDLPGASQFTASSADTPMGNADAVLVDAPAEVRKEIAWMKLSSTLHQTEVDARYDKMYNEAVNSNDPRYGWHGFCLLSPVVPNTQGYIQVSFEGANKICLLQEFLLMKLGVDTLLERYRAAELAGEGQGVHLQAHHRCTEPRCLIPQHIQLVPESFNQRVKGCRPWYQCRHHPPCKKWDYICEHVPGCIKYEPAMGDVTGVDFDQFIAQWPERHGNYDASARD